MKNLNKFLLGLILLLSISLRFFNLGSNPPSLYWEEAALGYDAYSILKTGKDFHGNSWPLVAFESFGDYKPSLYFYTTVPFVALFGLTPIAVRFPSALFGSLTILMVYLLAKEFFKKPAIPLLSALFLSLSPWHLQFSRAGFEANLGLFFVALGTWLFIKGLKKPYFLFSSITALVLSMYTYHANRVLVPLLGLSFGILYLKNLLRQKTTAILAVILFIFLFLPLGIKLNTPQVKQRYLQTSTFSNPELIIESNQKIQADGGGLISRFIHHRFFTYSKEFLTHYFDHYNFDYLFLTGDLNPRHSTQYAGHLFLVQFPLLLLGLFFIFKNKQTKLYPILIWLLLAPIPAALTKATPHALRSLSLVIPFSIISAYGLFSLIKRKWLVYLCLLVLLFEFFRFQYIYHFNYPKLHQFHWQYGYQQLIEYLKPIEPDYQNVYFSRTLGRPSIYYWFYNKTDPSLVQAAGSMSLKDQGEFLEFKNVKFELPKDNQYQANSLVIAASTDQVPFENPIKIIYNLNHEPVFKIFQN